VLRLVRWIGTVGAGDNLPRSTSYFGRCARASLPPPATGTFLRAQSIEWEETP